MLVMQIQTSGRRFADRAVVNTFFAQVLDAVRAVPGVATVGFTSQLPLSGDFERYGVRSEFGGYQGTADQSAFRYAVSGDYFSAMRIPVRHGRLLSAHDLADGPRVVVVSESLARRQFGDQDPLGQRIHVGDTAQPAYTVVGVAGDVKQASLAADEFAAAYVPASQWYFSDLALWLVVKTRGDAAALAPELRAAIWAVDKDQPIVRVATLNHIVEDSEADRRFAMLLFEAFAGVALSRSTIVRYVVREGMTMTTVGVIVGTGLALVASRVMLTMLFEVSPIDPPTYATVIVVLLAVSALASAVPAMRAAWIDPALTLRSE
jgi:putative ABC transport system permease protein